MTTTPTPKQDKAMALTPIQKIFRNYEKSNYGSKLLIEAKAEHAALTAVADAAKQTFAGYSPDEIDDSHNVKSG